MYTFNADLIEDIAKRRVVLFLGSGVSAGSKTKAGRNIRQWSDFLSETAKKIQNPDEKKQVEKLIEKRDLLMACELIRDCLGQEVWEGELRSEFAQIAIPSRLHKALINLKQRIIITTNFDKLIEEAWQTCSETSTHFPKIEIGISDETYKSFRDNQEYIIKMHGSIDVPDSIIFTKSDYNRLAYGSWLYIKFLETVLMTNTVMFVGFSMDDPAISYIIEMYALNLPKLRPHYIFLQNEEASPKIVEITKKLKRIFVIPYSAADSHKELSILIEDLNAQATIVRRENVAEEWKNLQAKSEK